jgi:hypothetical protein
LHFRLLGSIAYRLADGRFVGAEEEDVVALTAAGRHTGRPGWVAANLGEHEVAFREALGRTFLHPEKKKGV